MSRFSSTNQPKTKGRPKGSRNKRSLISDELHQGALDKLTAAVEAGESWAISAVLDRTSPKLKPTATGTEQTLIESQIALTDLRAKEISELEERLAAIEESLSDK